ncbi:MAG: hypothetical protein IJX74_01780 [Clostridia bacterium]|nr:hypothetical protein [Clostridia bacterium]
MNIMHTIRKKLPVLISAALFIGVDIYLVVDGYKEIILSPVRDDIFGNEFIFGFFLLMCIPCFLSQLLFLFQINYLSERKLCGGAKLCVWISISISALVIIAYASRLFEIYIPIFAPVAMLDFKIVEVLVFASPIISWLLYRLGKNLADRKEKHKID